MLLISHRGNIDGENPKQENCPRYIERAIQLGYNVEIDVRRINNQLFLGHDTPQYKIDIDWLHKHQRYLWIHAKNIDALSYLMTRMLSVFYHTIEEHVPIANTYNIWSHNIDDICERSIIPLLDKKSIEKTNIKSINVFGICSDYVEYLCDKCL